MEDVWDGERVVPGVPGLEELLQTHLARYALAACLGGRRVLDVGCGTGYGTDYLAAAYPRAMVVGVDVSEKALRFARSRYCRPNLVYLFGDGRQMPFADGNFDLIVCFEVIEHIREGEAVLSEIRRLLAPEGVLLISTPNRSIYSSGSETPWNPYHVREYTLEEWRVLLEQYFPYCEVWGQQHVIGSLFIRQSLRTGESLPIRTDLMMEEHPLEDSFFLLGVCALTPLTERGNVLDRPIAWMLEARPLQDALALKQRHLEELEIRWRRCEQHAQALAQRWRELESWLPVRAYLAVRNFVRRLRGRRR